MSKLSRKTVDELRKRGFTCDIVERWINFSNHRGVRKDLFGIADLIAFGSSRILLLQVCALTTKREHAQKIKRSQAAKDWIKNGGEVWLVLWRKLKGKSTREHWEPVWQRYCEMDDGRYGFKNYEDVLI